MRYIISPITSKKIISLKVYGNKNHSVDKVSNLENTNFNCLSFYSGDDLKYAESIKSGILLVKEDLLRNSANFKSKCVLFCDNPKYRFAEVINKTYKIEYSNQKIQNTCYRDERAKIDDSLLIAPNTSILENVEIHKNCRVQSGSVIGANGLGDIYFDGKYHSFPHFGKVVIEEDVHIGCNVSIMRGILEDTIIKKGTRIANNVCIGHSVSIGKNCYISSGVSIGGATTIHDNCWIAIGATIIDNIVVQKNTMLGTGAVLIKDALTNSVYLGNPARKINDRA